MSVAETKPKRSRTALWLLVAICAAPMIASYIAYYFWRPSAHVNYGELLPPHPLPDARAALIDGTPFSFPQLKGSWVLVMADSGRCDAYCETKLTYLRQLRLAQGKDTDRIERVWLVTDDAVPDPALAARYGGTLMVRAAGTQWLQALPAGNQADHLYIIDPVGNLMMRYPREADPRRILKDVSRLLRHSKWK
jgi:cytochrome oxidase Cu insertion factor (SCO1/SenC/PrrC family)